MKKIVNAFIYDPEEDAVFLSEIEFDTYIRQIIKIKKFSAKSENLVRAMVNYKKTEQKTEPGQNTIDANFNLLIPAGVDPHVHFDDPGFTFRENFYTGSLSAAFGGITTVIDMPSTSIPPVTNAKNLKGKLSKIRKKAVIDFALWGGISGTSFEKNADIEKKMSELASAGVVGFKTYLISGMEYFTSLTEDQLILVGKIAEKLDLPVAVHAEDRKIIEDKKRKFQSQGRIDISSYCQTRSIEAELKAVEKVIRVAKKTGAKFHIVHLSSKTGLQKIEAAQKKGVGISTETCPHFLAFTQADFKQIGSILKTAPPVKFAQDRDYLWKGLQNGSISFIATDHAGCIPTKEKTTGNIWSDYGGIPGTELMISFLFSYGFLQEKISLKRSIELVSENAAKFYQLFPQKGSLQLESDADFALIDLTRKCKIRGGDLHCKGKYTPFEGEMFDAKINQTFCRGRKIVEKGNSFGERGFGEFLD